MKLALVKALHVVPLHLVVLHAVVDHAAAGTRCPCPGGSAHRQSATEAERVKRGSTTISLAPRLALASVTHLKPQGCASAALPPMITTRSVFLMSVQELVIAPRPNVGARLATVGPCQTRAWLSNDQHAGAAHDLVGDEAGFVGGRGRGEQAGGDPAVDRHAVVVLGDEVRVAIVLHEPGDAVQRFVPGDPLRSCWSPACAPSDTSGASRDLHDSRAAPRPSGTACRGWSGWSESPSIWMISAFSPFFRSPLEVHDDAAGDGAIGAGVAGLGGVDELEGPDRRRMGSLYVTEAESSERRAGQARACGLQERAP